MELQILAGEMVFDSKIVEIQAKPEENIVEGLFSFEIKGGDLELEKLDAPCVCLMAKIEPTLSDKKPKLKWKSGEKGTVRARFELSTLRGLVEKNIYLKVKGETKKITLKVKIDVPELVEVTPSIHVWAIGKENAAKTFKIKVKHAKPISIKEHVGRNKEFPYELVVIKKGWEYEIKVHPKSTKSSGFGQIVLFTDSPLRKYKRYQVYVAVKKERPQTGK